MLTSTFPDQDDDGTPPFVFDLCRHLAAEFEITVLAPDAPGARRGGWAGLEVQRFRYAPRTWQQLTGGGGILGKLRAAPWRLLLIPPFLVGMAWALWRHRRKADLVHAHWLFPQGLIAVLCAGGRPVVCTSHGADVFALRGAAWDRVRRFVATRSRALTVVGATLEQAVGAFAGCGRVHRLPMGVDLGRFAPDPAVAIDAQQLLFVGRLVEKKGVDRLLRAYAGLRAARPDLRLQIAGDGPERPALEALAAALGCVDGVHFLGAVPPSRLPALYGRSAVVALPFRVAADGDEEGLGLTLVEAMACGCRLVTGRIEALGSDGAALPGLWSCPGDDPAELAAALAEALDDRRGGAELRAAREDWLAAFDWTQVAAAYGRVLRSALAT